MDRFPILYSHFVKRAGVIIFMCLLLISFPIYPQQPGDPLDNEPVVTIVESENDTLYHSPRKAAIYAAVLPGLGQIYNRKFWKLPIVYAGFGTLGYFITYNNSRFNKFKQAYKDFPDYKLDYSYPLTLEQIDRGMIFYRRYRDLSILGTFGFYLFQILDATVDAHLFDWDVGEDLSLKIEPSLMPPSIYNNTNTFGIRACLSF